MKVGFIGCGNMASAMIGGIIRNQVVAPQDILASAKTEASRERAAKNLGIRLAASNKEVASFADVLILAIKPFYYQEVIAQIREDVKEDTVIVSITPGKTLEWLEEQFGRPMKIVRTMPNTPALVGEGISCICPGPGATQEDTDKVCEIFSGFGKTELVTEPMIDVFVGVSGSSPAYVFMFIEALASAKMVLETGKHPGELKDMVCSPKGTTIEAVRILEEKGLRSAVFEAAKACIIKAREV